MGELIEEMQAKAHSLLDDIAILRSMIEQDDFDEENEELQEIASRMDNVQTELEYVEGLNPPAYPR